VRFSGKNTMASESRLLERRTSGQEMQVTTMEEGEINDVAGEEMVTNKRPGVHKGKG
jgi:hypothetical protein